MELYYVGNYIKQLRKVWNCPDLTLRDVHKVLNLLGFRSFGGRYPSGVFHDVMYGERWGQAMYVLEHLPADDNKQKKLNTPPKTNFNIPKNDEEEDDECYLSNMENASKECLRKDGVDPLMESKRIFITESQAKYIKENKEHKHYDPRKVLIVSKYLDNGFKRGEMSYVGNDGYPAVMKIVAMIGNDGNPLKNMTHNQLFYLLQDRFNKIFSDTMERDVFLKDIIEHWHNHNIDRNGIIRIKKVK